MVFIIQLTGPVNFTANTVRSSFCAADTAKILDRDNSIFDKSGRARREGTGYQVPKSFDTKFRLGIIIRFCYTVRIKKQRFACFQLETARREVTVAEQSQRQSGPIEQNIPAILDYDRRQMPGVQTSASPLAFILPNTSVAY